MANHRSRYNLMQKYVSEALMIDLALFILYLVFAGFGVIWMKTILVICILTLSLGTIGFLFICRELLRKRSRWMSVSAAAIFVCTLASLILNYPAPV